MWKVLAVASFVSSVSLTHAQTTQSDWERMFHKASPPAQAAAPAPITSAAGVEVFRDGTKGEKWLATGAQLAALKPWDPAKTPPPVALSELANRAKQYLVTSTRDAGWMIHGVEMFPLKTMNNAAWVFQFRFISLRNVRVELANQWFNGTNTGSAECSVFLLHDGTVLEPMTVR